MAADEMARASADDVLRRLRDVEVSTVADVLVHLGLNCTTGGLAPLAPDHRVCGRAHTMRYVPSQDPLAWRTDHVSVSSLAARCEPGDVIVVDAGGRPDVTSFGGNTARDVQRAGVAGVIYDGAVRDTGEILALGLPTFCRAVTATSSHGKFRTTCLDADPVQVGTLMVAPGDIVMADRDGMVVVPAAREVEIAELAARRGDYEDQIKAALGRGRSMTDPEVLEIIAAMKQLR